MIIWILLKNNIFTKSLDNSLKTIRQKCDKNHFKHYIILNDKKTSPDVTGLVFTYILFTKLN